VRELFNGVPYIVRTGKRVALHAERSAAVAGGVPADAPLDGGRGVRGGGSRRAGVAAALEQDYERLDTSLKRFHYIAFACIRIARMCKAFS
jgi:hypothetical protein